VAYNEPVEGLVNPPFTGIGYHRPTGEIMTYDMGEIGESTFENIAESDLDSYEEFMEIHGISEDAERLLEEYNHMYISFNRFILKTSSQHLRQ